MELGVVLAAIFKAGLLFVVSLVTAIIFIVLTAGKGKLVEIGGVILTFGSIFVYAFLFYGEEGVIMLLLAMSFTLPVLMYRG